MLIELGPELASLLVVSFLAATLLPLGSEVLLLGLVGQMPEQSAWFWLSASVGNTLGGLTNWWLGKYLLRYQHKRWFPVSEKRLMQVQSWVRRFGFPALLLSWLPVVGDAICLAAGVARLNGWLTCLWIFIGKSLRYAVVVLGTSALVLS